MTTFNSKETYLAYRSNWKAEYKQLSQTIRDCKFCRWFESLKNPDRITPELTEKYKSKLNSATQSYYIHSLKAQATAMLAELKEAKVEAQRQYLASKTTELVTA